MKFWVITTEPDKIKPYSQLGSMEPIRGMVSPFGDISPYLVCFPVVAYYELSIEALCLGN